MNEVEHDKLIEAITDASAARHQRADALIGALVADRRGENLADSVRTGGGG